MTEKLNKSYKVLKAEVTSNNTSELATVFETVSKALSDACELALKQTIPGKQLVLMADESFSCAGYALMIEDNPDHKIQPKKKTYATVAFGSEIFFLAQLKILTYSKELGTNYVVFFKFAYILWEATKMTIVLTDNKSVTRFFEPKPIALSLWNACEYVLQISLKIAPISRSVITVADFPSRLELNVTEKIHLKIREDVQTRPILPRMVQTMKSSSLHKQTVKMSRKSRPLNERNNPGEKQQNEEQMRNHPQRSQILRNSQRSTETPRRTPYDESKEMLGNEWSRMST